MKKIHLIYAACLLVGMGACAASVQKQVKDNVDVWKEYNTGAILFEDKAPETLGSDIYHRIIPDVESYIKETYLIAQTAGEVSEIFPKVGELVGTGAPIMNIAILDDMWITFNVREDLLQGLGMNTEFEAFIPALDKNIRLKVYYMKDLGTYAAWKATKTTGQFDLKTFEVKAAPQEKVEGLRPGMSVVLKK